MCTQSIVFSYPRLAPYCPAVCLAIVDRGILHGRQTISCTDKQNENRIVNLDSALCSLQKNTQETTRHFRRWKKVAWQNPSGGDLKTKRGKILAQAGNERAQR
jgi:hypothetical protein